MHLTGKEYIIPSGTPYYPSDGIHIEVHSLVPSSQSLICSMQALAAEAALESFLAAMISAPLVYILEL